MNNNRYTTAYNTARTQLMAIAAAPSADHESPEALLCDLLCELGCAEIVHRYHDAVEAIEMSGEAE